MPKILLITFNPLLPEVVGASILPSHVVAPHRQMIHCSHVCMAQVTEIDTAARIVRYLGEGAGTLPYDQLILACGTNANLEVVKGTGNYGLPLKTLGDAMFLRNRIIARLEQAELQPDPEHRRWLTSFIVVGGGFSGVETAGELVDFLYASLKYYRRISCEDLSIVLLHGTDRLLPELSPPLGDFTLRKMRARRIDVRLNARAVRVTDRDVHLESGEIIPGGTVICTIGTQPNGLLESIPAPKNRGRLAVNADFSVPGVEGVWAAGDCAAVVNALDAHGAGCRGPGQAAGGERRREAQGTGHPSLPLPSEGTAVLGGPQQGGRRSLRHQDLRLRGLAPVARLVPAAHSNTGAQGAAVPGAELDAVLSPRRRAPRLPPYPRRTAAVPTAPR